MYGRNWQKMCQVILAMLLLAGLVLSGCAPAATPVPAATPKPTEPGTATEVPPQAEPVKIRGTVWLGEAELAALEQLTEAYQETHPNVEVEWINIVGGGPYGRDKLRTMIAGGDAPDLMMLNTGQFEALATRGALLPLDSFVEKEGFDLSIYWPQAIEGSRYQGRLYALPRDMSNVILYYNKDLFDEAGVAYPTADWTWDDFLAAAQALTKDRNGDGEIDQWGFGILNWAWAWAGFVLGNGGEILSADRTQCLMEDPKTVEALKFYFDLQTKHEVSPPPGALPEQAWAGDWFLTQSAAMGLFGPWWRPALVTMENPFRWDVAYPPKSPNTGQRATVVYTDHWAISSGSKVADATWHFIKFLTSQQGQEIWVDLIGARSISPVQAVARSEEWVRYGGSSGEIILDTLAVGQAPPVNFGNADEAETIWNEEFGLVIAGEQTVEQAVAAICHRIAPVLAESQ
jgi:multiple sugar transport system substrate-binding protein